MIGLLAALVLGGDARISHTFKYVADRPLESVHLAGTFNNWDKGASPMAKAADGMTWKLAVDLSPGKHLYKFVLNGNDWIVDPKAAKNESDGNGHVNSVLTLLPADYAKPARPDDGIIAKSALQHRTGVPDLNWDRGKLTISFRTRPNDVQYVEMFLEDPSGEKCIELHPVAKDDFYAKWQAEIGWDRKRDLKYRIMVVDGPTRRYFTPNGLSESPVAAYTLNAKTFKPFLVPGWVEKSVVYQIFPDRFANGDKSNDPKDLTPWDGEPTYSNRFGGDVAGVRDHLDYLKSLGIKAVYFNPVFKSPSNHRYDATDYEAIDPQFGTNAEFFGLTKAMKAAGIRTIMDFAFNHTAVDFAPFADIREKGEASAYKNWYWIKSYPVEVKENPPYVAWFGFPSMPKLNVMNPATKAYVLGVVDFWKKNASLDGLRLDVANEVDMRMWRALRTHLKTTSPDTWILGEEWGDASAWLTGDQWDASMNYAFRDACIRYFAEDSISSQEFVGRLMRNYTLYAPQVSRNQLNLLSSHDTPRFLTLCKGSQPLATLAATVQLTWVGTPSIYYGEELGMQGGADPANRAGMKWDLATDANPMLKAYRKLIALRNSSAALQSGDPRMLACNDKTKTFAFARILPKDQAIVAVNRSDAKQRITIPLPAEVTARQFRDGLTGSQTVATNNVLTISIMPMSAVVLQPMQSNSRRPRGNAFTHPAHIESHPRPSLGDRRNP